MFYNVVSTMLGYQTNSFEDGRIATVSFHTGRAFCR